MFCLCYDVFMNEKKTAELTEILNNASLEDFASIREAELPKKERTLSEYLNTYIGSHNLVLADVVKDSRLSRDYAYSIINGNRPNPTRDRVIALCCAMKMSREEVQRALELCNAGILYPKNPRDMAIMICINREVYNILDINEFLLEHDLDIIHTSKDS